MTGASPVRVLHVHLGPADARGGADVRRLIGALREEPSVRQSAVVAGGPADSGGRRPLPPGRTRVVPTGGAGLLPAGLRPRALRAVARGLADLVRAPGAEPRAVQWPVPERWAVAHAHGAAALRAVWVAAAWRGSGARVVATPVAGEGAVPAGLWRKADLVAAPDPRGRGALGRAGVGFRRLRVAAPGDAADALEVYRELAGSERRRARRVPRRGGQGAP